MTILTTILTIILSILALGMLIHLLLLVATDILKAYNIKHHGCWWGNLPMWVTDIMQHYLF